MTKDELYESLIDRLMEENRQLRVALKTATPMVGMITCTVNGISFSPIWQKKAEEWLEKTGKEIWTTVEFIPESPLKKEYENIKTTHLSTHQIRRERSMT